MARKKRPSRKRKAAPEPTFDSDLTVWEQIVPPEIPVRYRKQDQEPPKTLTTDALWRQFDALPLGSDEAYRVLRQIRGAE